MLSAVFVILYVFAISGTLLKPLLFSCDYAVVIMSLVLYTRRYYRIASIDRIRTRNYTLAAVRLTDNRSIDLFNVQQTVFACVCTREDAEKRGKALGAWARRGMGCAPHRPTANTDLQAIVLCKAIVLAYDNGF